MLSAELSANSGIYAAIAEHETIPSSSMDSLPPNFAMLLESLLEELVRHESAVRTALQRALKEHVDNGGHLAPAGNDGISTLGEDSPRTGKIPTSSGSFVPPVDPVKQRDGGIPVVEDNINNGVLNETFKLCRESLDNSEKVAAMPNVRPDPPQQGTVSGSINPASPDTTCGGRHAHEGSRAKAKSVLIHSYTNDSYFSNDLVDQSLTVPRAREVAAARGAVRAGFKDRGENRGRHTLRALLQSVPCENLITSLILANAALLGYSADYSVRYPTRDQPVILRNIAFFFIVAFTVEIVLRIIAYGSSFMAVSNPDIFWNVFDTVLVVLALVEEIVLFISAETMEVSTVRLLRLLRLVRIVRVIRLLRFFYHLRMMILGVTGCMKPFIWALLLLGIIMYAFAVVFLQFVSDELAKPVHKPAADKVYFSSLSRAVYTLYMCIAGGISWVEVAEPLIEINLALAPLFMLYIAFSVFCVLNIVTGLFVERSSAMALEDSENVLMAEFDHRKKWITEIEDIFRQVDTDGSGAIRWEEFIESMKDFRVQACMTKLGVDLHRMCPLQLWSVLDVDGSGSVEISEFAYGLQHLRGNARSIDIFKIKRQQKTCTLSISELARVCEAKFMQLGDQVAALKQIQETEGKQFAEGIIVMNKLLHHRSTGHYSNKGESGFAQQQLFREALQRTSFSL